MFPDYFYILFLIVLCTFVGCLVHDVFLCLLDEFNKYIDRCGHNIKSLLVLVLFLVVMVAVLILPPALFAYVAAG